MIKFDKKKSFRFGYICFNKRKKIVTTLLMAVKLTLLKETWVDLPSRGRGYTDHNILYIG